MLSDFLKLQMDFVGARAELLASLISRSQLDRVTPETARPRPVLTIPGFLASETTLLRLNRYLARHGYAADSWGMGRNLGPQDRDWSIEIERLDRLVGERIRYLADKHSARVAVVGQSLGGVYARELALQMPEYIDRVIMLGAPTFHPYARTGHNRVIRLFGHWMARRSQAELAGRRGLLHWDASDPSLPCVSIFSPLDGIVDEASAAIPGYITRPTESAAPRENLRVTSSHIGMGVNPFVLLAVADRLAQDRDEWRAFDPYSLLPAHLHWAIPAIYPKVPEDVPASRIAKLADNSL